MYLFVMDIHVLRRSIHMEKIVVLFVNCVFVCCQGIVLDSSFSLSNPSLSFPSSLSLGAGLSVPQAPTLFSSQYRSGLATGPSLFPGSTLGGGASLFSSSPTRAPGRFMGPLRRRDRGRNIRLRGSPRNQYQPDRIGGHPPRSRGRPIRPVVGGRPTRPSGGNRTTRPTAADKTTRPIEGDGSSRPKSDGRLARPVGGETRNRTVANPHRNMQIIPISWPANRTISIPFRLPPRLTRARNDTAQSRPMTSSKRLPNRDPQASALGIRGLVSSIRREVPLRQTNKNVTRGQSEKLGQDLIRPGKGRKSLARPPSTYVRPSLRSQQRVPFLRSASPLGHTKSRTLPPIVRGQQNIGKLDRKQGPPTSSNLKQDAKIKASRRTLRQRIGKMKPIPSLPTKPSKATVQKSSAPIPATTTQDPYFTYNGSDLAHELNQTLGQYGLDVDGLIALLQEAKGDNRKSVPGAVNTRSSITGSGVTHSPVRNDMSKSALPKINNGTMDTPMRILSDLQRELNDITRMLEVGYGTGGMKQDTATTTPYTPPNNTPDTVLEPTANPLIEGLLLQHLIQSMGVQ